MDLGNLSEMGKLYSYLLGEELAGHCELCVVLVVIGKPEVVPQMLDISQYKIIAYNFTHFLTIK